MIKKQSAEVCDAANIFKAKSNYTDFDLNHKFLFQFINPKKYKLISNTYFKRRKKLFFIILFIFMSFCSLRHIILMRSIDCHMNNKCNTQLRKIQKIIQKQLLLQPTLGKYPNSSIVKNAYLKFCLPLLCKFYDNIK